MSEAVRRLSGIVLLFVIAGTARAQEKSKAASPGATADEAAVRALAAQFADAFNKHDAVAIATQFTENARVIDEDGHAVDGRAAIRERFTIAFEANPELKVDFATDTLRFVSPDVAVEEGRASAQGGSLSGMYTVLYVKHDGRWQIAGVRDHANVEEAPESPHARLEELAWLVGDWVDESDDETVVRTTCAWSDDGNYLIRHFKIEAAGKPVMSGSQRIGWDPQRKQIRTWVFDSDGGFSEGFVTRAAENQWVVKMTGTLSDGAAVSATNVITREHPDTMRWLSMDRTVGGEALPDAEEIVIARKPPGPGAAAPDEAKPAARGAGSR